MVAIAIFWASVMVILFFVLGIIFKGLAATMQALASVFTVVFSFLILGIMVVLALVVIYAITDSIVNHEFWSTLLGLVCSVFGVLIAIGIITWLGEIPLAIAIWLVGIVESILEWSAYTCEKIYVHFLQVIINRLNKC